MNLRIPCMMPANPPSGGSKPRGIRMAVTPSVALEFRKQVGGEVNPVESRTDELVIEAKKFSSGLIL